MRTITFGYNKLNTIGSSIPLIGMTVALVAIACLLNNPTQWLIFTPVAVVFFAVVRFFVLNYLLSMLKNKPALLLDDEKLISFIDEETIHWKNVVKISQEGKFVARHRYFIFELTNGDRIEIGTKWIEGSENFIYSNIQEFYSLAVKNKTSDTQFIS